MGITESVLGIVGIAVLLVVFIVVVAEIGTHVMQKRKLKLIRELAEKHPSLAHALIVEKPVVAGKRPALPFAKRVKVTVLMSGGNTLEDVCRIKKGIIHCGKIGMQFVPPEDYSPALAQVGRKLYAHYIFDEKGVALKINSIVQRDQDAEVAVEQYVPDPRITESIIGREALAQVFRQLGGFNFAAMFAGVGLGLLISYIIVFVVLPLAGVPVMVGRQPVEITIQPQQPYVGEVPPPGNYTVSLP